MRHSHAYIYLFKMGNSSIYKIGRSKNPTHRLKELQTGNSEKIYPVYAGFSLYSYSAEANVHRHFKRYKVQGEWFNLPDSQVKNVIALLKSIEAESIEQLNREELVKSKNGEIKKLRYNKLDNKIVSIFGNKHKLPFDIDKRESELEFQAFLDIVSTLGISPAGKDIIWVMWGVKPGKKYSKCASRRNLYAQHLKKLEVS